MKKITMIAIAAFLFAANTNAQVKRNVDASQKVQKDTTRKHRDGNMMKDLNLTPEQKSKMKELHLANRQEMDAIKNDQSLSEEQKKAKMQELRKIQKEKSKALLTAEQKAEIKAAARKGKDGHKRRHSNGMNDLNLTQDQKTRMNTIRQGFKEESEAIKNDENLTKEQKIEKSRQFRKSQQEQMKSILTPDQKTKMKAAKKHRKNDQDNNGKKRMKSPNKDLSTLPAKND